MYLFLLLYIIIYKDEWFYNKLRPIFTILLEVNLFFLYLQLISPFFFSFYFTRPFSLLPYQYHILSRQTQDGSSQILTQWKKITPLLSLFSSSFIFLFFFPLIDCCRSVGCRATHLAGGQVPTHKTLYPSSEGWEKSYTDFWPMKDRADGGRVSG